MSDKKCFECGDGFTHECNDVSICFECYIKDNQGSDLKAYNKPCGQVKKEEVVLMMTRREVTLMRHMILNYKYDYALEVKKEFERIVEKIEEAR